MRYRKQIINKFLYSLQKGKNERYSYNVLEKTSLNYMNDIPYYEDKPVYIVNIAKALGRFTIIKESKDFVFYLGSPFKPLSSKASVKVMREMTLLKTENPKISLDKICDLLKENEKFKNFSKSNFLNVTASKKDLELSF